jgi:hypothetical protein
VFAARRIALGPLTAREYADMYSAKRRAVFKAALKASAATTAGE